MLLILYLLKLLFSIWYYFALVFKTVYFHDHLQYSQTSIAVASTAEAAIVVSVVATHGVGGWGCSWVEKESRSVTWVWTFLPAEGLLYALSVGVTHPSFMPLASFMTDLISLLFTTIAWNNREIQQDCCVDIPVWIPLIQLRSWMRGVADSHLHSPVPDHLLF